MGFSSVIWVDPVLFGALYDVFWGLRFVLVGFLLVIMVKKRNFLGFGELRVGLGGLLWWIYGFWVFLSFWGLILLFLGLFLTCFGVSVWF